MLGKNKYTLEEGKQKNSRSYFLGVLATGIAIVGLLLILYYGLIYNTPIKKNGKNFFIPETKNNQKEKIYTNSNVIN